MKMKAVNKWGIGVAVAGMFLSSCTKNFADLNTSPVISQDAPPELLFTQSAKSVVDRDFDWFYDCYSYQLQWMQFGTAAPGSSATGLFSPNNTNNFYQGFYKDIARNLVEIEAMVNNKPESDRAAYANVVAIAKILKVYGAWRVSDANGSIPYSEALKARENQNFTPVYDTQEKMFDAWDKELKEAVAVLGKKLGSQAGLGTGDIFYSGKADKWIAAGNVLRMKIAMRLLKRAPEKTAAIVKEVVANADAGLFKSNADEWKFISADNNFARGGNWNMDNSPLSASQNMLNYMYDNKDPRLGLFFEKNSYTPELVDSLKNGGVFPATATYNPRRYFGLPSNPDKRADKNLASIFERKQYTMKFNGTNVDVTIDTVSRVQHRLFNLDAENGGANGARYTQPILTYAEQCFMMAELVVRGLISGDAKTYYESGVKASIQAYDDMGREAKIRDYAALDNAAVAAYIASPAIAFTGSQDVLLEKINIQNFLNHFKSPWEAWGAWKRTGIPKVNGILAFEQNTVSGVPVEVPRRWQLPQPTIANQTNWRNAIEEMKKTGEYGTNDNDFTGRVWWDKK
ncbi:SusD/RagB family nutrient-binding outer membrane lipoprotein [Chitinophaga solisilvae]|uniref:SusD/RagB family nutrient-binding outer membrane lipoprotein n=1 Tax=Chitinophaga solisilvae TaxID=1233460 RepID=UPI0013701221|nr:SusD/RagB family nutrient-binding outer membrane lipoprotein [Chitinophaga solisilvae]